MFESFLQNSAVGMTKEQYFEMCETLDSEPIEEEIPVEYGDFPDEIQLAISIYRLMRDEWEYMGGTYTGKNFNGVFELFEVYDISPVDKRYYLELIHIIDTIRIQETRKK
jgi:hypothetical protein